MAMILIPKANEERNNWPCWKGAETIEGKKLKPIVWCKCGLPIRISTNHSIQTDGTITPSFYHKDIIDGDNKGCGFHEYVKLKEYNGPAFSKEEGNG